MGATPMCCITPKAQYKDNAQTPQSQGTNQQPITDQKGIVQQKLNQQNINDSHSMNQKLQQQQNTQLMINNQSLLSSSQSQPNLLSNNLTNKNLQGLSTMPHLPLQDDINSLKGGPNSMNTGVRQLQTTDSRANLQIKTEQDQLQQLQNAKGQLTSSNKLNYINYQNHDIPQSQVQNEQTKSIKFNPDQMKENIDLKKGDLDKSIQGWIQNSKNVKHVQSANNINANLQNNSSTVILKNGNIPSNGVISRKDNSQYMNAAGKSISRINATLKSSKHVSLMNSNTHQNLQNTSRNNNENKSGLGGKKKKGKKKKRAVQTNNLMKNEQKLPPGQAIPNSNNQSIKNQTLLQNKTNTQMIESKNSVDFQVTYIERKQDSFYNKSNMTNVTNLLRYSNMTTSQNNGLKSNTKFINQKSIAEEGAEYIFDEILKRENMQHSNYNNNSSINDRSAKYIVGGNRPSIANNKNLEERKNPSQYISGPGSKPIFQQNQNPSAVKSPNFNQSNPIDSSGQLTTKMDKSLQRKSKQYPVIGDYNDNDDYEIASGGGQLAGDLDEDYQYEQGEPFDDQVEEEESFEKEGISPNEACYIDVDPIELNNLIPLNDSIALIRAVQYKGRTKLINGKAFHLWEPTIHEKMSFYNANPSPYLDEKMDFKLGQDQVWRRLQDINKVPLLMKDGEYEPNRIFQGEASVESVICAIIAVANHDHKFSTNYIGQSLYPQNMANNKQILQNSRPILSKHGKYGVKLFINGAERLVDIDDRLIYNTKYIHHLTNWIPETVNFEDLNNKESLWGRLLQNFREQNIIICLQENVLVNQQELQSSMKSSSEQFTRKFYAVLDLIETNDLKIIQCKSPSKGDKSLLKFIANCRQMPLEFQRENKNVLETGIFYMTWQDNISDYFNCITLCWNPKIYPFVKSVTTKFDFTLDRTIKLNKPQFSVYSCPQILFTIPPHQEDFEIRIMLRKHIKDYTVSNKVQFKLFTFDGQRIVYPHETLRNSLSNSREIMSDVFIFENSLEYECYVLALINDGEEDLSKIYEYFSLDVFSFIDVDLKELPFPQIDKKYTLNGQWGQRQKQLSNAGGLGISNTAAGSQAFQKQSVISTQTQQLPGIVYNPQYRLKIQEPTHLQLSLDTADTMDVMLSIHQTANDEIEEPFQNFLANSNQGFYFKGFGFTEILLEPMEYTLVIGSQEQQNSGEFRVDVKRIINSKISYKREIILEEMEPKGFPQDVKQSQVNKNTQNQQALANIDNKHSQNKLSQLESQQNSMRNDISRMRVDQLSFKNQFNFEIRKMQDEISDLRHINMKFENKFDNLFSALSELADNQKKLQGNMLSIQTNMGTMDKNVNLMRSDVNFITDQIRNNGLNNSSQSQTQQQQRPKQ
eukprot:403358689